MWGRVVSTGGVFAGLQAEAPSHRVKRWQHFNWQQRASTSRLRVATFTVTDPRRGRLSDINRGAVSGTPINEIKDHLAGSWAVRVGRDARERDLSTD